MNSPNIPKPAKIMAESLSIKETIYFGSNVFFGLLIPYIIIAYPRSVNIKIPVYGLKKRHFWHLTEGFFLRYNL